MGKVALGAEDGYVGYVDTVGIDGAASFDIIRDFFVFIPERAMHTHLGRALLSALPAERVVECVGDDQITPAGKQPIEIPLHVGSFKGVGVVFVSADPEAFVSVSAFSAMAGTVGGAFAHGAVNTPNVGRITRVQVSPHDILTGDTEMGQKMDV